MRLVKADSVSGLVDGLASVAEIGQPFVEPPQDRWRRELPRLMRSRRRLFAEPRPP